MTARNVSASFAVDNRSDVRTVTTIVKHQNQFRMKTKVNEQEMTEMVRNFIGGTTAPEKPKPEPQPTTTQEQVSEAVQQEIAMVYEPLPEQPDEAPQVVRRISGKQRRASLEEYKETFLPVPSIEDRKPVFLSRSTRDALDRIVRMFGERKMSVSGLVENIARQHLATYGEDIEAWRKL